VPVLPQARGEPEADVGAGRILSAPPSRSAQVLGLLIEVPRAVRLLRPDQQRRGSLPELSEVPSVTHAQIGFLA
jgi:hypothetical protein